MSGERKSGYSNQSSRLEKTKDRLHTLSLFAENNFSSPAEVLKRSNEIVKVFQKTLRGREGFANNIFSDYATTNDQKKIDYNDLLSAIFAIYNNEDVNRYYQKGVYQVQDWVRQTEINDVIDSLNGSNSDFISGKKNFLITKKVLPAYLIIRSFKEVNNEWFNEILSKFNNQERLELKDAITNLKKNLLFGVDSPEAKQVLSSQFEKSLHILQIKKNDKQKIKILSKKVIRDKEREELNQRTDAITYTPFIESKQEISEPATIYNRTEELPNHLRSKKKIVKKFKDENLWERNSSSNLYVHDEVFKTNFIQGSFEIANEKIEKMKSDNDYKNLINVLDKSSDLATFFAIIKFSSKEQFPHFDLPTEKDLPVITAFSQVFKKIMTNEKTYERLVNQYRKSKKNKLWNFYDLNEELAGMVYSRIIKEPFIPSELSNYLETPYFKKSILALKKLIDEKRINRKNLKKYIRTLNSLE